MINTDEISKIIDKEVTLDNSNSINQLLVSKNKYIGKIVNNNILIYPNNIEMVVLLCKYIKDFDKHNTVISICLENYAGFDLECFVLENLIEVLETEDINSSNINSIIYNTINNYEVVVGEKYKKLHTIYTYENRNKVINEIL